MVLAKYRDSELEIEYECTSVCARGHFNGTPIITDTSGAKCGDNSESESDFLKNQEFSIGLKLLSANYLLRFN